ncbi:DNA translocase FtsK [Thermoleophilia bacterium SCSIO 60948]|nr:DNA translocase FtsK [Thermoleophilia bacterium SCSIO 60948]
MATRSKPRSATSRARAKAPAKSAARRKPQRPSLRDRIAGLDQRAYDLAGLALIALAVYLAGVLYLGWEGGPIAGALSDGLAALFGKLAYAAPAALAAWGAMLVARPLIPARTALGAGAFLIGAALLLAFAAQTAGLGGERPIRRELFEPRFYTEHGGLTGETLYWATTSLFQRAGAHIVAVLLLISGLLLITGTTIAQLLEAVQRGGADAYRRANDSTREMARGAAEARLERRRERELEAARAEAPTRRFEPAPEADDDWEIDDGPPTGQHDPEPAAEPDPEPDPEPEAEVEGDFEPPPLPPEPDEGGIDVYEQGSSEPVATTPMGNRRTGGITESDELNYTKPSPRMLGKGKNDPGPDIRDREAVAKSLIEALKHFGVDAKLLGTVSGPHVSRYELQLAPGTKVGKVAQLKDDLAYALASTDIRILAPIPGKKAVGVEVPNARRRMVKLGDIYAGRPKGASPLVAWLGKDVAGQDCWTDLALMPHALVAGTTGSGKSGCINAMLSSILMDASPNEVRLVLVDPKRVELNHYERLPHLLTPVVTNPRLAATVLGNLIGEMENRYEVMSKARGRNLNELNKIRRKNGENPLPHILCVIDELADLMMVAPADVEESIIRLAQKSRAVGIHLVLATQRPSTDVITGTIKINIPSRIAFAVASQVDSRVILDSGGAESLLGQGDMLFRPVGSSKMQRIQGAFITEDEIARICSHWARQGEPEFDEEMLTEREEAPAEGGAEGELSPDQDDLLADAARIVVESETASVSMIQRRLRVGYTRAGRLIDMLERRGIISGYEGSKPRQVLVSQSDLPRMLENMGTQAIDDADAELESVR